MRCITTLALALFSIVFWIGCDPELGTAMEDVRKSAPGICKTLCEEVDKCEWNADGDFADDAEKASYDQCLIGCAWQMNEGAYVLTETTSTSGSEYEYSDHVSGSKVRGLLECLYNDADLFDCGSNDNFSLVVESEKDCKALQECQDAMDVKDLSDWVWTDGSGCRWDDTERVYLFLPGLPYLYVK